VEIVEAESRGVHYWAVDTWAEQGLRHGFCGADIDILTGQEQWERAFSSPGAEARLLLLEQVHGKEIARIGDFPGSTGFGNENLPGASIAEADGWLVYRGGAQLNSCFFGIKTADCFPVLFQGGRGELAGALHCGWRGSCGGILREAIMQACSLGMRAEEIQIAVGPGAQICCYCVGSEVAEQCCDAFERSGGCRMRTSQDVIEQRGSKLFCNLRALLTAQAVSCGVLPAHIVYSSHCTICDHRFFSYRRQKDLSGRQVSFITGAFHSSNM